MHTYVEIDADSADCHSDRFRVGQRRNRYGARLQDICRPVPRLHVVEGQTQLVRQSAAIICANANVKNSQFFTVTLMPASYHADGSKLSRRSREGREAQAISPGTAS
jgi:hypothetical protein